MTAQWKLVPVEPSDAEVTAYLTANTAYWKTVDELPRTPISKWRQGTPSEATRESLQASRAAAPPPPKTVLTEEERDGLATDVALRHVLSFSDSLEIVSAAERAILRKLAGGA